MPASPTRPTQSKRVSSRPDWVVLIYPGWKPDTVDMKNVPKDVPPAFMVCAGTGDVFHAKQTVDFYNAIFEVGQKTKPKPLNIEMHIYGTGGHGGGIFQKKSHPFSRWTDRFVEWANDLGILPTPKT